MMEDTQPPVPGIAPEVPPPSGEREPFWGWSDAVMLIGLGVPGMLVAATAAGFVLSRLTRLKAAQLVPAQFVGYGVLFLVVYLIFRLQYDRPFWRSLDWRPMGLPTGQVMVAGIATAFAVAITSIVLRTPNLPNPMTELLTGRVSILIVAAFGITLGPLAEELLFRGFLQPLMVRSLGTAAGILATAIPFGLLHLQQYGYSWRHGLLITLAGCAFGWMRHRTGSTRASTLMHAAYNALFFFALLAQRKELPHIW